MGGPHVPHLLHSGVVRIVPVHGGVSQSPGLVGRQSDGDRRQARRRGVKSALRSNKKGVPVVREGYARRPFRREGQRRAVRALPPQAGMVHARCQRGVDGGFEGSGVAADQRVFQGGGKHGVGREIHARGLDDGQQSGRQAVAQQGPRAVAPHFAGKGAQGRQGRFRRASGQAT